MSEQSSQPIRRNFYVFGMEIETDDWSEELLIQIRDHCIENNISPDQLLRKAIKEWMIKEQLVPGLN